MDKRKAFIAALLTLALVFVTIKNWDIIYQGLKVLQQARPQLLIISLILLIVTFFLAALSYKLLALHKTILRQLLVLELAAAAVNRLLPAGLGGLGLNGWYLLKHKHSAPEATAVISTNNLLGMLVHASAFIAMLCLGYGRLPHGLVISSTAVVLLVIVAALLIAIGLKFRRKIGQFLINVWRSLKSYRKRPLQLITAAAAQLCLTICNVLILELSMRAAQIDMPLSTVFVVYSLGVLLGALMPTPGGVAGVEAGLTGGLVAYGASLDLAAAAVIAFRVVTFWLPIIPGALALFWLQKQGLLKGARRHITGAE